MNPFDTGATLFDCLTYWAQETPERPALSVLNASGETEKSYNFSELSRCGEQMAAWLACKVEPGERVLLLFENTASFALSFLACLRLGAIAVPAPLRIDPARIANIVADCQPRLVLFEETAGTSEAQSWQEELRGLPLCAVPSNPQEESFEATATFGRGRVSEHTPAVLQYTSGTTSRPKGVVVTHANLMANFRLLYDAVQMDEKAIVVSWLPIFHDMGLFGGLLQAPLGGGHTVLLPRTTTLRNPLRWLEVISKFRATHSGAPNFAFDACVDALARNRQAPDLDLSSWRVAWNAAEHVQARTLVNFTRAFAPFGLRAEAQCPIYGIAEATLFVAGSAVQALPLVGRWEMMAQNRVRSIEDWSSPCDEANLRDWVSCGSASPGTDLLIVDPVALEEVNERTIGEVWVAGPQVAARYWSQDLPLGTLVGAGQTERRYLRTGDLGVVSDGQLYITGRLKDLIIWHGRNISPHDLEQIACDAHELVTPGYVAAFSLDHPAPNEIILVIGQRKAVTSVQADEIRQAVTQQITQTFEIALDRVVFVPRHAIERTSSGKIRRAAIAQAYQDKRLEVIFPQGERRLSPVQNETAAPGQEKLFSLLAQVSAVEEPSRSGEFSVDLSLSLPHAGYDSLKILLLSGLIEDQYGTVPPYDFFYQVPAGALAEWLAKTPVKPPPKARPTSPLATLPLSREQAALYFFEEEDWRAVVLLPLLVAVDTMSDEDIRDRFAALLERYPILTARVATQQGRPVFQFPAHGHDIVRSVSDERVDFVAPFKGSDVSQLEQDLWHRAKKPLDMRQNAPIRLVVGPPLQGQRVLVFAVHHLVCDARSLEVMAKTFLSGPEISSVQGGAAISCALLAEQEANLCGPAFKTALNYWCRTLKGVPSEISPPWPHVTQETKGAGVSDEMPVRRFRIRPQTVASVKQIAAQCEIGVPAVYLAAWQLALQTMGVSVPAAVTITQAEKQRLLPGTGIGYGVRPTPIRMDKIGSGMRYSDFVQKVNLRIREGLTHEAAPYPKIIEQLGAARGGRYAPFMQFQFGFGRFPVTLHESLDAACQEQEGEGFCGFLLAQMPHLAQANLQVFEGGKTTAAMLVYDPKTVHPQTAHSLELVFLKVLSALVSQPQAEIGAEALWPFLPVKGPLKRASRPFQPVHIMARTFRAKMAQELAIIEGADQLRRDEMWRRADQLSHAIARRLDQKGSVVAIFLPRSADLVIAQLAILQSGHTCLPIDVKTPKARVLEMLGDAQTALIVTQAELWDESLKDFAYLDCHKSGGDGAEFTPVAVTEDAAAILIYTSGSTGRAKGVIFPHGALSRRIEDLSTLMDVRTHDRVLAYVSPGADPSVQEYWMALTRGAALVIAPQGHGFDPHEVVEIMVRDNVTHGVGLPVMLHALVDQPAYRQCYDFKALTCGGELLSETLRDKVTQGHKVRLINVYGATETTICATTFDVTEQNGARVSAVGFPMDDTEVIICNDALQPVPPGVVGEILIGGASLALGYVANPTETEKRFVCLKGAGSTERFYRTGDLGWMEDDGLLRFAGRLDHQVKISGYRVEPDEIIQRLSALSGVNDAFVCASPKEEGDGVELLAYAVLAPGSTLSRLDLKRELDRVLPPPLRPAAYVLLEKFPMTTNGKVDRKSLPQPQKEDRCAGPDGLGFAQASSVRLSGSALEEQLMMFWAQALGQPDIKPHDNFFDLGGHSLLAFQIVSKIEDSLGVHIPANIIYRAATVRELALEITRLSKEQRARDLPAALTPLNSNGNLPPLFLISPGLSGDVALEQLAGHFDRDRPVYRLSYPGLGQQGEFASVAALAQSYVEAIQTLTALGPIYLAGYSTGGIIAYEAARLAEEKGLKVYGLVLLDSLDVKASAYGYRLLDFLKSWPHLTQVLSSFGFAKSLHNLLHDKRLLRQMEMIRSYQPLPWKGRAAFLKCSDNMWLHNRRAKQWQKSCAKLHEFEVAGDHSTVFHDGNVQKLAYRLTEIMKSWEAS